MMRVFQDRIVRLIVGYFAGSLTREEGQELEKWLEGGAGRREMLERMCGGEALEEREAVWKRTHKAEALRRFERRMRGGRRRVVALWARYAAVVVLAVVAVWMWQRGDEVKEAALVVIRPGDSRAVLTLENGEGVELCGMSEGELCIAQSGASVRSGEKGIVYRDAPGGDGVKGYNRLTTPRGGEYGVTLSDGTKVYLNAASDLRYPVVFDGESREVFLSGEAYFKVAGDSLRPFYVVAGGVRIGVYGTAFNVHSRAGEGVETVLVEGRIGIRGAGAEEYELRPSELAEFSAEGRFVRREKVDVLPYVAWKDGQFVFRNERLEEIMSALSLWYDVDVFYGDERLKEHRFTGHMKKYEDVHTILNAIREIMEVEFVVSGKTITVMR